MNFKYGKLVILGLTLIIAGAGCSNAGGGANRPLITQDEIEKNKKDAAMKRPDTPEKK